ncbi:hypothetical protein [Bradyrhizobium iriomotense]|uniref:hypothetical protein n=1 Tax=Bradyrhizobium iriomotense TaxID=441950 RepID=UPI001B8A1E36|nr:hypothetical protein [Bradyrhizobium iriomotense]MBR0784918.1 hypothetical protein [Bradyrhizobium iriomotense]
MSVLSLDSEAGGRPDRSELPDEIEVVRLAPPSAIQGIVRKLNLVHSTIVNRVATEFVSNFVYPKSNFLIGALRRRVAEFHPELAIFIAQPFFVPLLGLKLESLDEIRKIAFFSDPWPYRGLPSPYDRYAFPLAGNYNRKLISRVYANFDRVIYTNSSAVEFMLNHYPELERNSNKLAVAAHLADELIEIPSKEVVDRVRSSVVHLGDLSKERFSPQLREAMAQCIHSHGISFTFIGSVCERLRQGVESGDFGNGVCLLGSLPDKFSRYIASRALANLIVEADIKDSPYLPSKLTDVLTSSDRWVFVSGTRRQPGIGITSERAAKGTCVPHDSAAIVDALLAVTRSHSINVDRCVGSLRVGAIERNRSLATKYLE